jgi:hypothetical protein
MGDDIRRTISYVKFNLFGDTIVSSKYCRTEDERHTMSRFIDIEFDNKELPPICGYWAEKLVSLEQALAPVMHRIDQLDRSVKAAKKYCHFPSRHGLTLDESAALYLYTMEGGDNSFYRVLNQALRSEDRRALQIWFPYLKLLDTALSKLPDIRRNIWRGVLGDIGKDFQKNEAFTWWNVSSCSLSVDVIKNFISSDTKSTLFLIEATHGKDISSYTNYPTEDEVLLAPGVQLRVVANALDHPGGLNIVHLLEVTDGDDEHLPSAVPATKILSNSSEKDVSSEY